MKKILSAILALILVFALSVCMAEEAAGEGTDLSNITIPDYSQYIDPVEKSDTQTKGSVTTDTVTINGSQYRVVLPTGVTMTYTATDDAVCFTQDVLQQSSLFSKWIRDPLATVSNWIDHQMHMNIYRPSTKVDIYIHVVDTSLSQIYPNSNSLSDEEADYLFNYMMNTEGLFKGATSGTCGWLGGNVWFLADMRDYDGTVTLISFVGGKEIFCYATIGSDDQYADMINLLDNLTIAVG